MNTLLRITVIAQQGLQEAWYSRFYLLVAVITVICAGLGLFAGELVLTGSEGTRLTVYNFSARLALAAVFAIYVAQSLLRDRLEKQTEIYLSLDMPREVYVLGRSLGFMAVLVIGVCLAALYPAWHVSLGVTSGWALSLFAELSIVLFLTVFVTITLNNAAASLSVVAGFYLLARNMGNLLLLSQSPILEGREGGLEWAKSVLQLINVVLPDLWRFAPSDWLIGNTVNTADLAMNILAAGLFCLLLFTAASFDLHRKNL